MQTAGHATEHHRGRPAHEHGNYREQAPDGEQDVVRKGEDGPKENGQSSPPQLAVVLHADTPVVHARILGRGRRPAPPYDLGVRRALVLALATILALVGCGGEAKRLSREEYAQQADAICAKGNRRTEQLPSPGNLSELADVTDKTLDILEGALNDLRKLKPPSDQQKIADQWLAQLETLTEDLEEIRDEARANDIQAVQAIAEKAQDHNTRANELGTTLGMKVCNTTN
jgi:hypothetical protein